MTKNNPHDPTRAEQTRQRLLNAFWHVLFQQGLKTLAVEDITRQAQLNRTTFYLHFEDKYRIAEVAIGEKLQADLLYHLSQAQTLSQATLAQIMELIFQSFIVIRSKTPIADFQLETLIEAQIKQQVAYYLFGELAKIKPTAEARQLAIAVSWAMYGLAENWYENERDIPKQERIQMTSHWLAQWLGV
ncbi:MAG TPA: TetR/AcrR family transcriptional regulator [Anaerolineales bacterium]|nr:TetR/AcrR family transcriptional regulator [Anaerolineales bacterium]